MICKQCGQDHHKALACIGAKGGAAGKGKKVDRRKMRAMAMKRWGGKNP